MKVKQIVANIESSDIAKAKAFYGDLLGLHELMNHGWIATYGSNEKMSVQLSIASEGGSGAETPNLSIEVDDVDGAYAMMQGAGIDIEYGLVDEPWGVRRFFVRDPYGKLINILSHG